MRRIILVLAVLCLAVSVFAQTSSPVSLPTTLKQGQALHYNLRLVASGETVLPGSAEKIPLDVTLDAAISYSVGQASAEGITPVTIAADRVAAVYPDRTMELTKEFFPQSIAMIDKNGEITRLLTGDATAAKIPGINSSNIILLFRSYAPQADLKVGSVWKKLIALVPQPDSYDISYTLEGLEDACGVQSAKIRSDITVVPPAGSDYTAKGFAISDFALDDGRLVKSHVEMTIKMKTAAPQTPTGTAGSAKPGDVTAVVKWDVQPAPTVSTPAKTDK